MMDQVTNLVIATPCLQASDYSRLPVLEFPKELPYSSIHDRVGDHRGDQETSSQREAGVLRFVYQLDTERKPSGPELATLAAVSSKPTIPPRLHAFAKPLSAASTPLAR